jgi:hypothetical protein
MKRIPLKIFIVTALLLGAAPVSIAQKSVKDIIQAAETLYSSDADSLPLNICYVAPSKGTVIYSINGVNRTIEERWNPFMIPAGSHTLVGKKYETRDEFLQTDALISAIFEFEEGKCYSVGFERNAENGFTQVGLITDTAVLARAENAMAKYKDSIEKMRERQKEYRTFQEANPNHLNGIWSGEKKRMMNTFLIKYTIEGGKMIFEGKNKLINRPLVVEGRFVYNENTIVFTPENVTVNGKAIDLVGNQSKFVWYYTLKNGVLHLEGGNAFLAKELRWENTGDLRRGN